MLNGITRVRDIIASFVSMPNEISSTVFLKTWFMGAGISFTMTSNALYKECPARRELDNKSRASGNYWVKRFVLFIIKNFTIPNGIKADKRAKIRKYGVVRAAIIRQGRQKRAETSIKTST